MKPGYTVGTLAVSLFLVACASGRTTAPAAGIGLDHAALHVADLHRSSTFYQQLGLRVIDEPFKDGRHVWLSMGPRLQLHLIAGRTEDRQSDIDVHLAFRVPSVAELASRLDERKVVYFDTKQEPHAITNRPDGVRQIYFQDPDGYWIEVNDAKSDSPQR